MQIINKIFCTWFYFGYVPFAPGTCGTIATLPFYVLLSKFSLVNYAISIVILFILGVRCTGLLAGKDKDPQFIVIDEVVGFLVTMFGISVSWSNILVGLILFRLLDIFKPWPVGYLDKNITGGLGIMLDDLVAGLLACVILHFYNTALF